MGGPPPGLSSAGAGTGTALPCRPCACSHAAPRHAAPCRARAATSSPPPPPPARTPRRPGGAIAIRDGAVARVVDCAFESWSAPRGGAIAAESGAALEVVRSNFTQCTATGASIVDGGGAIHVTGGPAPAKASISDCVFTRCSAVDFGGAVAGASFDAALTVSGSTFLDNRCSSAGPRQGRAKRPQPALPRLRLALARRRSPRQLQPHIHCSPSAPAAPAPPPLPPRPPKGPHMAAQSTPATA
jgi:hypothetical protein